jgi:hypothetical protein
MRNLEMICHNRLRIVCRLALAIVFLATPRGLDAKARLNGHIVRLRPDGFILRTRFYPRINVHLSEQTTVRCKKHILKAIDLEMDDLVTVEALDKNGILEATKITIRRDWLKCREINGEKPAHCKC